MGLIEDEVQGVDGRPNVFLLGILLTEEMRVVEADNLGPLYEFNRRLLRALHVLFRFVCSERVVPFDLAVPGKCRDRLR